MDRIRVLGTPRDELKRLLVERGFKPYRAEQLYRWVFNRLVLDIDRMTDISKADRAAFAELLDLSLPDVVDVKSAADGTAKLLLRYGDGALVECVLIPMPDYTTLCISSQVGCRFGCRFCLTARMGFVRNLDAHEICAQYVLARRHLGNRIRNIVFMGMGEPLDNLDAVVDAIKVLYDNVGAAFSPNRVTVSTIGLTPRIYELANAVPVSLAFSMNAPNDAIRDELMPINRKHPLAGVMGALADFPLKRRAQITVEYVMLKGVNDGADHARELAEVLNDPARFKVNLIPFNPYSGARFEPPTEAGVLEFQSILKSLGYRCNLRASKGREIFAACGQLGYSALKKGGTRWQTS